MAVYKSSCWSSGPSDLAELPKSLSWAERPKVPPLLTDDELRDGSDDPGVLGGNCIDGGFEALSIRGGRSGTAERKVKISFGNKKSIPMTFIDDCHLL